MLVLWFNKRSQQKVYNALFSKGSEYKHIYKLYSIVSQGSGTEIYNHKMALTNSLAAELKWPFCQYVPQVWLALGQAELYWLLQLGSDFYQVQLG